ncbi:MAG: acyclic terpene utilization AtuA family protein [Clostridia bacterium]
MKSIKILAPCGILGYGFPQESFERGMAAHPDAIIVDAGSTDAGPHKLGAGVAIVSDEAMHRDLELIIMAAARAGIPVLIGSAGGSGGRVHVEHTVSIIRQIMSDHSLYALRTAVIWADIPKDMVKQRLLEGRVIPLGNEVPELTPEQLEETVSVVAQMGHEPFLYALEQGYQLIIGGRAYDPSPFAAFCQYHGLKLAYGYHIGKILECAALCAIPGTTKDCMLGTVYEDGFSVEPLSDARRCTPLSVAAHTFYEKEHPYILHGPGIVMDLSACSFEQRTKGSVYVSGSQLQPTSQYCVKLEGARTVAYRTFVIAGVRDPLMIRQLDKIEAAAEEQVREYYKNIYTDPYEIHFLNYGWNAVLGKSEPKRELPHEVGLLFEVIAKTQRQANAVCATLRSTLLHFGYEGRKSTAGNLAFPFAPSDVSFGRVYAFSVYHLMEISNEEATNLFPVEPVVWDMEDIK